MEHESVSTHPVVALRSVTKRFGELVANDGIDLDLYAGEVHALLGENGAGKTTLLKVIYGLARPDAGAITVQGTVRHIRSPRDARGLGIGMAFQHFALVPAMSVTENVALFLSGLPSQGVWLDPRGLAERIRSIGQRYGLQVNPQAKVKALSVGERQQTELVKLVLSGAKVLLCDEPTSALPPHVTEGLLHAFAALKQGGYAVLFVTHRLREALAVADRVTVLRHGKVALSRPRAQVTHEGLLALMQSAAQKSPAQGVAALVQRDGAPALELVDVWASEREGGPGLRGVSLRVWPGEVLGVAAAPGNGQELLGDVLVGVTERKGTVFLSGRSTAGWPPSRVRQAGVGYVPEEPLSAVAPQMSVAENLALGWVGRSWWAGLLLSDRRVLKDARRLVAGLPFELPPLGKRVDALSGGNVQRVVLARELAGAPRVLITCHPTRGLDVASAESVRARLRALCGKGMAMLLVSEDPDELLSLSDRLIVLRDGHIRSELTPSETSPAALGLLMAGDDGRRTVAGALAAGGGVSP
ncbi:MAG: ATP-binding cassette domain-containing protein [Dehalococcoidia bacterium]|nr:ATP-binding cassette domain-containing protein [Dehalococcoidia bacterium]